MLEIWCVIHTPSTSRFGLVCGPPRPAAVISDSTAPSDDPERARRSGSTLCLPGAVCVNCSDVPSSSLSFCDFRSPTKGPTRRVRLPSLFYKEAEAERREVTWPWATWDSSLETKPCWLWSPGVLGSRGGRSPSTCTPGRGPVMSP